MLDPTAKKVLKLLERDQPEDLRCAALKVLREVGSRDPQLSRILCDILDDPSESVRREACLTVGHLRIEAALPRLLSRVREGGTQAEAAAEALAHLGAPGIRGLKELMSQVAPGLRRRIAAALGHGGGTGTAATDVLLDSDPGVVDAAVRSLMSEVRSFSPSQRHQLADHILELLAPKKRAHLSTVSETAFIRVLAALGDPRSEALLWARVGQSFPVEVRAAALQALGAHASTHDKANLKLLVDCATDRDFRLAAPALMILKPMPVMERGIKDWLRLFDAPDSAVRRFAMEKLADRDSPEIAQALLDQLGHPDVELRSVALAKLAESEQGRTLLVESMLATASSEEAWILARAQLPFIGHYSDKLRTKIFAQACKYLEAGDRRADSLLHLLRAADPRGLRDQLEERGLALRRKKAYSEALIYLRLLTREPSCAESIRFEMAACALKQSQRDLAVEYRTADPCLQQFGRLIHNHEVNPLERIKAAKWLAADELFYVGFHFTESDARERSFGAELLRLVVQRSRATKIGKDARSKLRSAGLK